MFRRTPLWVCALAAGLSAASALAQTTITQWTFNSNPTDGNAGTGTFNPALGAGAATCFNVAPSLPLAECIFASGNLSTDPETADDSGWQTRGYQAQGGPPGTVGVEFAVNTTNFSNIVVTWDQRHSNTSSRFCALWYSTDGTNFVQFPTVFEGNMGDTWFNQRTVNLTGIPGVDNNPSFRFRISPVFDPATGNSYTATTSTSTYASTGTYRFDMVTIAGTALSSVPPSGSAQASPGAVCAGGGQVTFTVTVIPGLNPPSTGLTVNADLTSVGGSATAGLFDDGSNGDTTPGDNVFTLLYTVPGSVAVGAKTIPVSIADAQARSTSNSLAFNVANCTTNSNSRVVISQVYGGGGNTGTPMGVFNADFVELYNRSNQTIDLTGWSVQYASAGAVGGFDNASDRVQLAGVIRPGQYLLVQFSAPGAAGAPLPTPDFAGEGGMGNSGGRVALVRGTTLIGANCADTNVEDLAAYGAAVCFEGAAPAGGTANDVGIIRKLSGAQDTNQNFNDFTVGAPTPRNRSSNGFLAGYGSLSASSLCAGDGLGFTVNVSPAASPTSTGIQMRADLTQLGGSATQALTDSGGNVFTLNYTVPASVTQGVKVIPLTVTDVQGRTDSSTLNITIATCTASASRVVVSAFFGGGGNTGAPFNTDHIEIFNRSGSSVNLTGWSVQYADAANATGFLATRVIPLSGVIGAGEYRLIAVSAAGADGIPIPTPDFTASPVFGMDNASGRIAVVRVVTALGTNCASPDIEDLVGYGADALCVEGIGPTADITNTTGGFRRGDGCQDFNHNAIDFQILAPINLPRNSATAANPCPQPATGACCRGTGCSLTTASACIGANSFFAGAGTICNVPGNATAPCCKADYNQSGAITVQDIFDFLAGYFTGNLLADINASGGVTVQDIFDFLAAYFAGGC